MLRVAPATSRWAIGGAVAGLGARLLAGSYYGQTIQIWSALIMAAVLAAVLVNIIALAQRVTLKRMGFET